MTNDERIAALEDEIAQVEGRSAHVRGVWLHTQGSLERAELHAIVFHASVYHGCLTRRIAELRATE